MALTDKETLALKPKAKKFKVFDGDGLYILVHPEGGKYWYMKYHFGARPQEIASGTYPAFGLASVAMRPAREEKALRGEDEAAEENFKAALDCRPDLLLRPLHGARDGDFLSAGYRCAAIAV